MRILEGNEKRYERENVIEEKRKEKMAEKR